MTAIRDLLQVHPPLRNTDGVGQNSKTDYYTQKTVGTKDNHVLGSEPQRLVEIQQTF